MLCIDLKYLYKKKEKYKYNAMFGRKKWSIKEEVN